MATVLVVDDAPESLIAMEQAVREVDPGLHVLPAKNKGEALQLIESEPVDLVVTDLALHSQGLDEDGMEVAGAASHKDVNLPVILVTRYLTPEVAEKAMAANVFDMMDMTAQPLAPGRMLVYKIRSALRFRQAVQQAPKAL